jgi:hypothetical protein
MAEIILEICVTQYKVLSMCFEMSWSYKGVGFNCNLWPLHYIDYYPVSCNVVSNYVWTLVVHNMICYCLCVPCVVGNN